MRRICLALPLVWLAALDMSRVGADEGPVANPACSARIIHEFDIKRDGSEFLIVPVKIAGETFSAAIDTGATWTIVDTSLRQLVGKELGQIDAETPNGTTPFRYYKGMEIEIGTEPAKVTPEKVICCDLASFRYYSKQDFYVMIGMDVLQRFALHLDLPQGKATIFEEAPQTSCKATQLAYFGQIPCVVGWFGDTSSWFMIDTGKLGGGEGDLSHGAFGRLRQRGLLTVTGRTLSISAGGEAEHRSGRVKSLVLADQLYTEAAFSEAESCRLGLAHLSRLTVTLDFPNNVAYFDLPQPLKAAGPLASLGLLTRWQDGKLSSQTPMPTVVRRRRVFGSAIKLSPSTALI